MFLVHGETADAKLGESQNKLRRQPIFPVPFRDRLGRGDVVEEPAQAVAEHQNLI